MFNIIYLNTNIFKLFELYNFFAKYYFYIKILAFFSHNIVIIEFVIKNNDFIIK